MKMRISVGVAVARKMFGARGDFGFESRDERASELRNDMRVARKRSLTNHGIRRVRINIKHGREIDIKSSIAHLLTESLTEFAHARFTPRTHFAHRWKRFKAFRQTRDATTFLIDREQQRTLRNRLEFMNQRASLITRPNIARKQNDARHA